jgi:hypothetical protein
MTRLGPQGHRNTKMDVYYRKFWGFSITMAFYQPRTTLMYATRNFLCMHTSLSVTVFVLVSSVLGSCWFNPVSWHQVGVRSPSHERSPYRDAVWLGQLSEAYSVQCESFKAFSSLATLAEKYVVSERIPLRVNKNWYTSRSWFIYLYTVSIRRIIIGLESWIWYFLINCL